MKLGLGAVALLLGGSVALTACSGGVNAPSTPVPPGPLDHVSGSLTVLADPALRDVFNQVAAAVKRDHPRVTVRVRYGSPTSGTGGADMVASFSRQVMGQLESEGVVGEASVVAQLTPALVVAPRNPGHVGQLSDLDRPGVSTALCSTTTTCGEATSDLLRRADVAPGQVRRVADSAAGLQAVTDSSVDSAVVWASDIRGASGQAAFGRGVREVPLAAASSQNIRLTGSGSRPVLVAVAARGNQQAADAFLNQLRGEFGQHLLRSDGFR